MWWMLGSSVLAATVTVPLDVQVSVSPVESVRAACSPIDDAHQRCTVPGGWIRLAGGPIRREELWLAPDDAIRRTDGGTFEGEGAAAIELQRTVAAWVAERPVDDLPAATRAARQLRKHVARQEVDEGLRARIIDHGLSEIATRLVEGTPTQVLFEDATFYTRMEEALDLRPEVVEDPRFWSFGWYYGRMCGGVTTYGVEEAVRRAAARTDDVGRHPTLGGTISWAIESATTPEELAALDRAMAQWKALDPPGPVWDRYAARVATKQSAGPGRPAPALSAIDADGVQRSLDDLEGPVVIDFWGTWCAPCIASIPKMKALREQWGSKITFLALASEKEGGHAAWRATVRKHAWGEGFVHWMHWDPDLNARWSIVKWPTYVVLDDEHRIVSFASDTDELEAAIGEAVDGG